MYTWNGNDTVWCIENERDLPLAQRTAWEWGRMNAKCLNECEQIALEQFSVNGGTSDTYKHTHALRQCERAQFKSYFT